MVVDETAAWLTFEQLRWNGAPGQCPHCGATGRCYFLSPTSGTRLTRHGSPTVRRVWKCGACRRQFSVLTGTVFQGTRIPLAVWLAVLSDLLGGPKVPDGLVSVTARGRMEQVLRAGVYAAVVT